LTESETLFEEFCGSAGWQYERISVSEREGERRPDYQINLASGQKLVVEV